MCAAVGVAITLGVVAAQAVSASPVPARPDAMRAPQPIARWRLPQLASRVGTAALSPSGQASWRVIFGAGLTTPMYLLGVAALNPHDAWAVGYTQRDYAVALHWIQGRWQRIPIPGAYQFFPQYVAASSPRDVWIFGYRNTAAGQPWQALRWDGQAWHQVPQPPEPGVANEVGFLVLGPSSVWFPSQSSCQSAGSICKTPVCRWNGRRWVVYRLNASVTGLAASGRSNIWAVGFRLPASSRPGSNAHPVTYRWTGAVWRTIRMPSHAITGFHNGGPVIDSWGPRAVWIGSEAENPGGGALLMHWDGLRWQEHQLPVIGGTAVIDWPLGVWTSPWAYWTGRTWQVIGIPQWMNVVYYLARVPHSETMLAVGGTLLSKGRFRGEIFSYGKFG
jgi:hypothetical protein